MTNEEAVTYLVNYCQDCEDYINNECVSDSRCFEAKSKAIDALRAQKCDAISRESALSADICEGIKCDECPFSYGLMCKLYIYISDLPLVTPKQKTGHCKDCKHFEHDSVAKVDGVPLIVAHEICSKWGDGCKTKEDGYCFLYEPQESEGTE